MNTLPKDLFRRYETPPTPLHDEVQKLARREGWTAPWDREEQTRTAGKKSGFIRAKRGKLRLSVIQMAYNALSPAYKHRPFSVETIFAVLREYLRLVGRPLSAPKDGPPRQSNDELTQISDELKVHSIMAELPETDREELQLVSYETVRKGLLQLGVRSGRTSDRSR